MSEKKDDYLKNDLWQGNVSSSGNTPNQNHELSYVYNLSPSPKRLSKSIVRMPSHETLKRTRDGVDSEVINEDGELENGKQPKKKRKHSPSSDSFSDEGSSEGTPLKTTVMDVAVANSVSCNWQHLSLEATTLFNSSLLKQCKTVPFSLTNFEKSLVEKEMEQVLSQVKSELVTATAPRMTSKVSYSKLKQQVSDLKMKCLSLIQQNNDLLKQLVETKKYIEEKNDRIRELGVSQLRNHHDVTNDLLQRTQTLPHYQMNSELNFEDYLVDLLDASHNKT